ncbi:MAG TPA: hypothetical protein VK177_19760 [Flavobacteriales bacterium]|nr:hypothetical protein [Flavobacteriales bacterium]
MGTLLKKSKSLDEGKISKTDKRINDAEFEKMKFETRSQKEIENSRIKVYKYAID